MRKELEDISYKSKRRTVVNLWKTLHILQEIHNVRFWDFYNSDAAFGNWCASKGYGETDPSGVRRGASNIWYKEWTDDIRRGDWKEVPYCSFIDMFGDDIPDLGNDESEEIYKIDFKQMMEVAVYKDNKQFGKPDYRVHLTGILIAELGNSIMVDQIP